MRRSASLNWTRRSNDGLNKKRLTRLMKKESLASNGRLRDDVLNLVLATTRVCLKLFFRQHQKPHKQQ